MTIHHGRPRGRRPRCVELRKTECGAELGAAPGAEGHVIHPSRDSPVTRVRAGSGWSQSAHGVV